MNEIAWMEDPPKGPRLPHLPLTTVRASKEIRGLITCERILGVGTHFLGGRTQPHYKGHCAGCEALLPIRPEAYVSILTVKPTNHILCRLTLDPWNAILDQAPNRKMLRGLHVTLKRSGARDNSRLLAKIDEFDYSQVRLPEPPLLIAHLMLIWGIDPSAQIEGVTENESEIIEEFNRITGGTNA